MPDATPAPADPPADPPETVVEPESRWPVPDFGDLWRYRELLVFLAWRDVQVRYKQTALGAAWAVVQPLLMMGVFWLFLRPPADAPAPSGVPPAVVLYAGLLAWYLFANAVTGAANSVVESERLVSKVYFPRLVIPLAAAGPAVIDFGVASVMLAGLMVATGTPVAATAVLVPVAAGLILLAAVGVGTLLSALNVAYRDFRYVVPFLIQVGMFATLFATSRDYLGGGRAVRTRSAGRSRRNPVAGLIDFFRAALFGTPLHWPAVGRAAAAGAGLFALGCGYFRRVEDTFADVI